MPRRQPIATATARPRATRRTRAAVISLSLTTVLLGTTPPQARAGESWRLPVVDTRVDAGFRVTPGAPFAAGQRRGIDLHAPSGTAVRSACSGRVRFAGAVPRREVGVTVRCTGGPWVATHLGLARVAVSPGQPVLAGRTVLGTVGSTGSVRLGARRDGRRHGYVDPLQLLDAGATELPVPLAPPAGPLAPRQPPGRPAPRRPRITTRPDAPRAPVVPVPAWIGLGLAAAALPITLAGRARVRTRAARRARAVPGVAHR